MVTKEEIRYAITQLESGIWNADQGIDRLKRYKKKLQKQKREQIKILRSIK